MKLKLILSFTLFSTVITFAQEPSNWKFYTDMKNISDLRITSSGFWSATNGGAFYYNAEKDSFRTLRRNDGLFGVSLTSLCIDNQNKIWFGGSGGTIDVYDPGQNSIHNILDILNSEKTLKQLNSLTASGDTIIAAADFGVCLINSTNYTFLETFTKLGNLPSNYKINYAVKLDLIYACTDLGLAVQKAGASNLSDPESWITYGINQGSSTVVNKVIKYNNLILAATNSGLAAQNGNLWIPFIPELNGEISDLELSGDSLFILSENKVYLYNGGNLTELYSSPGELKKIEYGGSLGAIAATSGGVLRVSAGTYFYPNGPEANKFSSLSIDKDNFLWVASGESQGVGFFRYDGELWSNFNLSNTPQLTSNSYFISYSAPDNTKYFGSWGQGFARLKNNQINIFDTNNTDMEGTDENPSFLVISGFASDSRNNLWILNSYAVNKKPLSMLTPDSSWVHYSVGATGNLYLEKQLNLAIDQYDTKWYSSHDEHGQKHGLFYFNENKTYENTSDDRSGFLNSSNGLNDDLVTAVTPDIRGDIWVGTGFGVNIITNTQSIPGGSANLSVNSVFSLRQQSVNCIAVDPLNQKWVGTNQGLHIVNSDGSRLIASYTTENSILPSNEIESIAIDASSGRIYIGTDLGLLSFDTPSIQPKENYTELLLYPNPFVLNGSSTQLKIRNLIRDSEIKILTITGRLVKYIEAETEYSPGGDIAFWDGTDSDGNLVNSGVYFVVAFDKEGNNIVSGKVAVIKE